MKLTTNDKSDSIRAAEICVFALLTLIGGAGLVEVLTVLRGLN